MAEDLDPYAVLGISAAATTAVIRKRFHALARTAHPDLVGDGGLVMMQRLNAAWDILRDPVRRAIYDATRPGSWRRAGAGGTMAGGSAGVAHGGGHRAHDSRHDGAVAPAWTGAAGPPPGRPSGSRLAFGLYANWTLGEIARYDTGYLSWLVERKEGRPFAAEIKVILDGLRAVAPERPRSRRWRGR